MVPHRSRVWYTCRICANHRKLPVELDLTERGFVLDAHNNRLQRVYCPSCGQDRTHVLDTDLGNPEPLPDLGVPTDE